MSNPFRKEHRGPGLMEPISHYCDAVSYGGLVFVSGCAPVDKSGAVVSDDVLEQTRQVFRNIDAALKEAGSGIDQILKVTVYLVDVDDLKRVDIARREVFGDVRPASTLVEVSRLAIPGMLVEIEAVAAVHAASADKD